MKKSLEEGKVFFIFSEIPIVATVLEITSQLDNNDIIPSDTNSTTPTPPLTIVFPSLTPSTATTEKPAVINEDNLFFSPELYRYAQEGDYAGVRRALDAGADSNGAVRRGGFTPLHTAAYNGG